MFTLQLKFNLYGNSINIEKNKSIIAENEELKYILEALDNKTIKNSKDFILKVEYFQI